MDIKRILLGCSLFASNCMADSNEVSLYGNPYIHGGRNKTSFPTVTRGEDGVELSADSIITDAHIIIIDECQRTVANTFMTISPAPIHITLPDSPQKEYESNKSYTIEIKYDDASLVGEFK